ncbi:MAG: protein kinase domain-containing protein [Phototrophicaceae bacterium]
MDEASNVNQTIRGYEIKRQIGQGGFGSVYIAYQPIVDREVAIKVILPKYANDPVFVRRFDTEARLVARLEHPFTVPLYDYWREPSGAYLVMRYFNVGSLSDFIETNGAMRPRQALRMMEQITNALDNAHRHHVIHLDIKPANILLDGDQNAYLTDFGISRVFEASSPDYRDPVNTLSLVYAAPELVQMNPPSYQADIYSLGILLYEMLAGQHPFTHLNTFHELVRAKINQPLPYLQTVSPSLNDVLTLATTKDISTRYQSSLELLYALQTALEPQVVVASPAPTRSPSNSTQPLLNPYKGLRAFAEADAGEFYGRDGLVKRLLNRLTDVHPYSRFLALVGASGSGKSSVLQAGLVSALRANQLEGSQAWYIASMVPGHTPLQNLETALLSVGVKHHPKIGEYLRTTSDSLLRLVHHLLPEKEAELVLVIDQFEELFTQAEDAEREQFLKLLTRTVLSKNSNVRFLIGMRADFYDRPLSHPEFSRLLQDRTEVILPLTAQELERVIVAPVEKLGLSVEPELLAEMVASVHNETAALPLLQYALTELFEQRENDKLTLRAYQAIGGISGALAKRAEELYSELSEPLKFVVQQLFLRLVTLGEGAEDTRRRASQSELQSVIEQPQHLKIVLDLFGKYRLLTFSNDPETREPTVEVAHESLLRAWGRYRQWIDQLRADIRQQRDLSSVAMAWQSAKRDESYLISGTRLDQLHQWAQESALALSKTEREFLQSSLEARTQRLAEINEQQQREAVLLLRSRNRLRIALGIFAVATLVAIGLTLYALQQQSEAVASNTRSNGLLWLANAQRALADGNANLALVFAHQTDSIIGIEDAQRNILEGIASAPGVSHQFQAHDATIISMAFSHDGRYLITAEGEPVDVARPQEAPPQQGAGQGGQQPPPARAEDSNLSTTPTRGLAVWDTRTWQEVARFQNHQRNIQDFTLIEDDGQHLVASISRGGQVLLWDYQTGEPQRQLTDLRESGNYSISYNGDGLLAVGVRPRSQLQVWNLDREGLLPVRTPLINDTMSHINFIPNTSQLLLSYVSGRQLIYDVIAQQVLFDGIPDGMPNASDPAYLDSTRITPDGKQAFFNLGTNVLVWDIASDTLQRLPIASTPNIALAIADDASLLLSVAGSGVLQVWNTDSTAFTSVLRSDLEELYRATISPSGRWVALGNEMGTVQVWEIRTRSPYVLGNIPTQGIQSKLRFLDDDRLVANQLIIQPGERSIPGLFMSNLITNVRTPYDSDHLPPYSLFGLDVTQDGRYTVGLTSYHIPGLYSTGDANLFSVWDNDTLKVVKTFPYADLTEFRTLTLAPTDSEELVVAVALGNQVEGWNIQTEERVFNFTPATETVHDLAYLPNNEGILALSDQTHLTLWSVEDATQTQTWELPFEAVAFAIHPNGTLLAFVLPATQDQHVLLYDLKTQTVTQRLVGHEARVVSLDFSEDGTRLTSGDGNGSVILWETSSGMLLNHYVLPNNLSDLRFSPDQSKIAALTSKGGIFLLDASSSTKDDLFKWLDGNRLISTITDVDCRLYNILTLCQSQGVLDVTPQ